VKHLFARLRLSRKLMAGPSVSAAFLLLLGAAVCIGYSKGILLVLLGVTMFATIATSLAAARLITSTLDLVLKGINAVSKGDLTKRIASVSADEIGEVILQFNSFADNLRRIMIHLADDSEQISTAGGRMEAAIQQVAKGFEETRGQVSSVATASEGLATTSSEIARNCAAAAQGSAHSNDAVKAGSIVIDETVAVMRAISEKVKGLAIVMESLGRSSDQVGQVVGLINDIADQTNLLALNAAIEAARAGDQGRGFAVVADEVRKLAERTTEATREIAGTIAAMQAETKGIVASIEESVKEVDLGSQKTSQSKSFLCDVAIQIDTVDAQISQIAAAVEQENETTAETSRNIQQVSQVMLVISQEVAEAAPAAAKVAKVAEALEAVVKQFKVA